MKFSDRNNRLLLVISLIGAIFSSISIVSHLINVLFQETYSGVLALSALTFVGPIALSSEIVVTIYGSFYAYAEARIYMRYQKKSQLRKVESIADKRYKLFLTVTKYISLFSVILLIKS